jgi:hypothetical protein
LHSQWLRRYLSTVDSCSTPISGAADAYRNLLRNCVSVRQHGKVVARGQTVVMTNVVFRVAPAGVQRIRRRHEREVVAYVRGTVESLSDEPLALPADAQRVCFNPFEHDTFVLEDGSPVWAADAFYMTSPCGSWAVNPRSN